LPQTFRRLQSELRYSDAHQCIAAEIRENDQALVETVTVAKKKERHVLWTHVSHAHACSQLGA
jgi:hypothetical protein